MRSTPLRAVVIADFTAANLAACLTHDEATPLVDAVAISYASLGAELPSGDVAVVWTRPETVSAAFASHLRSGDGDTTAMLRDVDGFIELLSRLRPRFAHLLVVSWLPPRLSELWPSLAMQHDIGISTLVMRMNLRLAEGLMAVPGAVLLDAARWRSVDRTAEEAKLWYAAKVPFHSDVFRRAAQQVKGSVRAARGDSRKVIVLDLDDTLWGGLVGETGPAALRLGGHDATGEAFADFQRALLALKERGVLLAIASKNDERVALDAIETHPEMVLRRSDFAAWRIDWTDKAANILALARELNLGLQSMVFIDDSAIERARVREALPDVLVPDWPSSPLLYVDALVSLGCFDAVTLTGEDRARATQYADERVRTAEREAMGVDDWLRRLDLQIDVEELHDRNAPRAVQLLNKTNQMNLRTRRLDHAQFNAWLAGGRRKAWTFRVRDRFGDAGLTGLASIEIDDATARLTDFVLSCRVFGRRIELAMLHTVSEWARRQGARELVADYEPTAKNAPTLTFLESSGLRQTAPGQFTWNLDDAFAAPADLVINEEAGLRA
ncbi:MAG: HAD-IIIC family phosphatase [Acidobacteria bacterium]|nr:HAD-IIIC family phosphatase [Acidobacteriota bacterium]